MSRLRRYLVPALLLVPVIFICGKLLLTPVPTATPPDLREFSTYIGAWPRHEIGWPWIYCLAPDGGSADFFSVPLLSADCLVLLGIIAASGAFILLFLRRRIKGLRFSLRGLMITIALISGGCAWWISNLDDYKHVMITFEGRRPSRTVAQFSLNGWQYFGPQWLGRLAPDSILWFLRRPTELGVSFQGDSGADAADEIAAVLLELPHIRQLGIGRHRFPILRDLIQRRALDRIEGIRLSSDDAAFNDEIECLGKISKLRRFGIISTKEGIPKTPLFGDKLKHLQDCHSLEDLTIHGAWMSDDEFAYLPAIPTLRGLSLHSFLITGACIDDILKQRNLEALVYSPNHITEHDIRRFFALPKLRAFWCACPYSEWLLRLGVSRRFPGYEWVHDRFVEDLAMRN